MKSENKIGVEKVSKREGKILKSKKFIGKRALPEKNTFPMGKDRKNPGNEGREKYKGG